VNEVYAAISNQLQNTPLAGLANRQLPEKVGSVQVANVPALERIPALVGQLNTWRWILLGLTVLLLALAALASRNRRRTLAGIGIGLIVAGLLTLVVLRVIRTMTLDPIADPTYRAAAVAVWQTVLNTFLVQLIVTAVLGLAIAATGWLAGPGRVATSIRLTFQRWLSGAHAAVMPAAGNWGWVKATRRYHRPIQWGLLVATLLVLLALTPLTVPTIIAVLVLSVLVLVLLELVVAPEGGINAWQKANPAASQPAQPSEKPTR
jgi:hypothetical protein